VASLFGTGATGPLLITLLLLGALAMVLMRRAQQAAPSPVAS
jgi:hypothetical protein